MNNLQAKDLSKLSKSTLFSEDIELKDIKNIKPGTWIELDCNSIKFNFLNRDELIATALLEAFGDYFYINYKKTNPKKYKKSKKKDIINCYFKTNYNFKSGKYAIAKMPLVVDCEGVNFKARANLYFNELFFLEIKEVL